MARLFDGFAYVIVPPSLSPGGRPHTGLPVPAAIYSISKLTTPQDYCHSGRMSFDLPVPCSKCQELSDPGGGMLHEPTENPVFNIFSTTTAKPNDSASRPSRMQNAASYEEVRRRQNRSVKMLEIKDGALPSENPETDSVDELERQGSWNCERDNDSDKTTSHNSSQLSQSLDEKEVVQAIIIAFDSFRTQNTENTNNAGTGNRRQRSSQQGNNQQDNGRAKRPLQESDNSEKDNSQNSDSSGRKKARTSADESEAYPVFACPFSKRHPVAHKRCYRFHLKRIRDVKQHLRRRHHNPIYCPVCRQVFDDEDARDRHVIARTCPPNPLPVVQGITEAQKKKLGERCTSGLSEEDQWFLVFDIVFPGCARPKSPYVDPLLTEELRSFQDFQASEGPRIVTDYFRRRGLLDQLDDATLDRLLADALERVADRWRIQSHLQIAHTHTSVPLQQRRSSGTESAEDTLDRPLLWNPGVDVFPVNTLPVSPLGPHREYQATQGNASSRRPHDTRSPARAGRLVSSPILPLPFTLEESVRHLEHPFAFSLFGDIPTDTGELHSGALLPIEDVDFHIGSDFDLEMSLASTGTGSSWGMGSLGSPSGLGS